MDEIFETITVKKHNEKEGETDHGAYKLTTITDIKGRTFESFDKLGWSVIDGNKYKIGFRIWHNGNLRFNKLEEI